MLHAAPGVRETVEEDCVRGDAVPPFRGVVLDKIYPLSAFWERIMAMAVAFIVFPSCEIRERP